MTIRVIVPDFLGNGRSDRLDKWPSDLWFDWAKQVKVLCDEIRVKTDMAEVHVFEHGGHPAMLSNMDEFIGLCGQFFSKT